MPEKKKMISQPNVVFPTARTMRFVASMKGDVLTDVYEHATLIDFFLIQQIHERIHKMTLWQLLAVWLDR